MSDKIHSTGTQSSGFRELYSRFKAGVATCFGIRKVSQVPHQRLNIPTGIHFASSPRQKGLETITVQPQSKVKPKIPAEQSKAMHSSQKPESPPRSPRTKTTDSTAVHSPGGKNTPTPKKLDGKSVEPAPVSTKTPGRSRDAATQTPANKGTHQPSAGATGTVQTEEQLRARLAALREDSGPAGTLPTEEQLRARLEALQDLPGPYNYESFTKALYGVETVEGLVKLWQYLRSDSAKSRMSLENIFDLRKKFPGRLNMVSKKPGQAALVTEKMLKVMIPNQELRNDIGHQILTTRLKQLKE